MMTIYSATKAALDMITKASAKELACKGIRVNSVNPGVVQTAVMRQIKDEKVAEAIYNKIAETTPLKLKALPEDIANVILFLANNKLTRNITGSIVVSDTGFLADPGSMRPKNT